MSTVKNFTGTLANNERRKYPLRGSFFYLRSANQALQVELVRVGLGQQEGNNTNLEMQGGDKVTPKTEYDEVVLFNDSGVSVTFEIVGGDGDYDRPTPDTVNVAVSTPASNSITDAADVACNELTATQIVAANSTRTRVIIGAPEANDVNLRVGSSNVTATRGQQLKPGETIAFDTSAAIYAIEESAGTTTASVVQETITP